jgi:hypothetical protein
MAESKKDLTDGLAGADTHHGKIEELTANNPAGLKGLIKNRYATLVGFSIGFGGLLYGYPSVGFLPTKTQGARMQSLYGTNRASYPTSSRTRISAPISLASTPIPPTRDGWSL